MRRLFVVAALALTVAAVPASGRPAPRAPIAATHHVEEDTLMTAHITINGAALTVESFENPGITFTGIIMISGQPWSSTVTFTNANQEPSEGVLPFGDVVFVKDGTAITVTPPTPES